MQEIELFSVEEKNDLLHLVENACGLTLPRDEVRFGKLTFHLYRYQQSREFYFLMRWGLQKIFSAKGIHSSEPKRVLKKIQSLISNNKAAIKKALIDYYGDQLNNLAQIELQPELIRQCSDAQNLDLKICHARSCHPKNTEHHGWPNFCVVISWLDDYGEFQEFLFALPLDSRSKSFTIPGEKIISQFRRYRDSLL